MTHRYVTAQRRGYEFGLLDQNAKREIRRASFKALCIPGYQVPFASREMPIARGFGTGGMQLTLSIIGSDDTLKVIDQGADESVNACNIRKLVSRVCPGVKSTTQTRDATIIQTRHRVPEAELRKGQIMVYQVPYPDALTLVEPNGFKRSAMHAEADYGRLYVKLYEDIVTYDEITLSHRYPTRVHEHYIIDPSPIPRWDVPRLHQSSCIHLFGAGRERRIYAVPPYTDARPLEFEDVAFRVEDFSTPGGGRQPCERCGATDSFLDEIYLDTGEISWMCSDTEYCTANLQKGAR